MAVRIAVMQLVSVDSTGKIVKKNKDATIGQVMKSNTIHKVYQFKPGSAPNAAGPNTEVPPDLYDYLNAEVGDGYELVHLDQTFIITSNA